MGSISSWRVVAPRIRTGAFGTSSVERVCARTDGLITSTPQVLPLRFGITTALQINPFLKNCERWVYLAFLKWCAIPKWVPLRWYHFLLVSSVPFVPLFTIYIFFGVWASSDMSLKCFEAHKLTSAARAIPASTEHFPYEQYSLIFVIDAHINVTAR